MGRYYLKQNTREHDLSLQRRVAARSRRKLGANLSTPALRGVAVIWAALCFSSCLKGGFGNRNVILHEGSAR